MSQFLLLIFNVTLATLLSNSLQHGSCYVNDHKGGVACNCYKSNNVWCTVLSQTISNIDQEFRPDCKFTTTSHLLINKDIMVMIA